VATHENKLRRWKLGKGGLAELCPILLAGGVVCLLAEIQRWLADPGEHPEREWLAMVMSTGMLAITCVMSVLIFRAMRHGLYDGFDQRLLHGSDSERSRSR